MSKFCTNCGTMLNDEALFCGNCGTKMGVEPAPAPQQEYVYVEQPQPTPKKPAGQKIMDWIKKNPLLAGGAVLVVVAVIVGALFLGGAFGGKYDEALDNYMAIMNGDSSVTALKKMYPKCIWSEIDFEDYAEELEETLSSVPSGVEYSCDVVDDEEITGSMLSSLKDELEDEYGVDPSDVGAAYKIQIELTVEYQGESHTQDSGDSAGVVEIDGKWYLLDIEVEDGEVEEATFFEF